MKKVILGLIIGIISLTGFTVYGMGKVIPKKTPMQNVGNGAYCWTPDGKIAFYRLIDHWIKMEPDPFPGGGGVYDDYEKDDEAFIVVRDPQTKEEKVLFKVPYKGAAGRATYMDWSPKTNKILLTTGALLILSPDGKELRDVAPRDRICGQGTWSPDGDKILYDAGPIPDEKTGPKPGLYLMNADGSDDYLLVENGMSGSWAPDGKQIVYQTAARQTTPEERKTELYRNIFYTSDIYIINIDGTGKRLLVENGSSPRWIPNKKWIFFACGWHVDAIRPDGTDRRTVPITTPVTPPYPPPWQIILNRGNVWSKYDVEVLEDEDKRINQ